MRSSLAAILAVALLIVGGRALAAVHAPFAQAPAGASVRTLKVHYRTHDGHRASAYILLPAGYTPADNPPLPLVISPHGRGIRAAANIRRFGQLPALGSFAVVSPDGHGRRLELFSWGYPGQIADLARMPAIIARALPWVRIDRRRIYAVGSSMGGQEALLLLGRYPRLLAGAAAFNPVTDLARRYREFPRLRCGASCRRTWKQPLGKALRYLARQEVGGAPGRTPSAYARRSPLTYARAIASSGVPVELWWSRKDRIVTSGAMQAGLLARRLRRLNPRAPVHEVVGSWPHDAEMRSRWGLPYALARLGLLPPLFAQRVRFGSGANSSIPAPAGPHVPAAAPGVRPEMLFVRESPVPSPGTWEIAAIDMSGPPARPLRPLDGPLQAARWSPDGRWLAYQARTSQTLRVASLGGGAGASVSPVGYHTYDAAAAWSPDSRRIAYSGTLGVTVANRDGTARRRVAWFRDEYDPAWSPDGTKIAFTRARWAPGSLAPRHGRLFVARADGRGRAQLLPARPSIPVGPSFSPDGDLIATGSFRGAGVTVVRADGSGGVRKLAGCCAARQVAWSPDGERIAFLNGESELGVFGGVVDVASGRVTILRPPPHIPRLVRGPAWAPDGSRLAFVACAPEPGGTCKLYSVDRDGLVFVRLARVCLACGRAGLVAPGWRRARPTDAVP